MARVTTKEFGELESVWKNVPAEGILLREANGVVLLEQHFNDVDGRREDVLFQFEEGITLDDKNDFCECLAEARKFEPDFSVPIYIQTLSERKKEEEAAKNERWTYYENLAERSARRPWNFSLR